MVKGIGAQNLPSDVTQLIDQLERHCLAPDGSLVSKSAYYDLQLVLLTYFSPLFFCLTSHGRVVI